MKDELDPFREWDAAYVLGALGMDERRTFEHHLESCPACTNSVGKLAGIPGILKKISPEHAIGIVDALPLEKSSTELASVQSLAVYAISRKKIARRKLISATAVAAAFVMVIGIGIGTTLKGSTPLADNPISVSAASIQVLMSDKGKHEMSVAMTATSKRWGTQIQWDCTYVLARTLEQAPEYYGLVITTTTGAKVLIATWRVLGEVAKDLSATTNVPISEIKSVEIRETGKTSPIVSGSISA